MDLYSGEAASPRGVAPAGWPLVVWPPEGAKLRYAAWLVGCGEWG